VARTGAKTVCVAGNGSTIDEAAYDYINTIAPRTSHFRAMVCFDGFHPLTNKISFYHNDFLVFTFCLDLLYLEGCEFY
jgi:hypothetical protein